MSAPEIVEANKECFEKVNTITKLSVPHMIKYEGSFIEPGKDRKDKPNPKAQRWVLQH